jgi:hypothetical protein
LGVATALGTSMAREVNRACSKACPSPLCTTFFTPGIPATAKITDKSIVLDAQTLPRVQMPNRDGFS